MNKKKPRTNIVDKDTAQHVESHLSNHKEIDTSKVEVHVDGGVVILKGEIDNDRAKQLVASIVTDEVQIKEVSNDLAARRDISEAPPSLDITDKA